MSLITQLSNAFTATGTKIKAVNTLINGNVSNLLALNTSIKDSLVNAINEVNGVNLPYRSGTRFHAAVTAIAPSAQAITAGQLRAHPILIRRAVTITELRAEVTVIGAASTFRLGIYRDNGSLYPGSLVAGSDVSTIVSSVVGVKTVTFASPIVLSPGLYWVVINTAVAFTIRAIPVSACLPILGSLVTIGTAAPITGYTIGFAFAAMPSVYPASAAFLNNSLAPWVIFRVQ
jgi:hypothetical protein